MPKPFLKMLRGEKTKDTPFWFMRQAGRYLPEYRALRAQKNGFLGLAMDPVSACEVTVQPIRRFGMSAAILFSDILVIPMALGQKLEFLENEGPKLEALESVQDLARLDFSHFSKLDPVYETLGLIRETLKEEGFPETALIGFSGAPWTLATYMIEGGSSRDFLKTKLLAYRDPQGFEALMDILVEAVTKYLIAQVEAGAEVLQIFDSWAGALDADQFMRWSSEPTRRIVAGVRAAYPDIPIIGFPRGAGYNYKLYFEKTGVTALSIDQHVPLSVMKDYQALGPVQGNLDPLCLLAGGAALEKGAQDILNTLGRGSFIFNLGHGIHKDTPIEHVEALVGMIKNHG